MFQRDISVPLNPSVTLNVASIWENNFDETYLYNSGFCCLAHGLVEIPGGFPNRARVEQRFHFISISVALVETKVYGSLFFINTNSWVRNLPKFTPVTWSITLHSPSLSLQLREFYGVGILPSGGENKQPQPLADWHTVEGCSLTPHCIRFIGTKHTQENHLPAELLPPMMSCSQHWFVISSFRTMLCQHGKVVPNGSAWQQWALIWWHDNMSPLCLPWGSVSALASCGPIVQRFFCSYFLFCLNSSLWYLPEDDVAGPVGLPGLDQCKVSCDGLLHDVLPAVELAHLETPQLKQVWELGRIIIFEQIN